MQTRDRFQHSGRIFNPEIPGLSIPISGCWVGNRDWKSGLSDWIKNTINIIFRDNKIVLLQILFTTARTGCWDYICRPMFPILYIINYRSSLVKVGGVAQWLVERRSLTGELSLSCAWPAADGWPLEHSNSGRKKFRFDSILATE